MGTDQKRLKKRLDNLVKGAAAQGVPLSQIPAYLDMIMQRNGVSAEKRGTVLRIAEQSIHKIDYYLIA